MAYTEKKRTKFLALPIYFTTYRIDDDVINIKKGFLSITEDDAYMYKIQDVRLHKSMMERVFKLGTVICFTGDTTHSELKLVHIRNSDTIKEYILSASEEARRKRRTMHRLDIGTDEIDDVDLE